MHKILIIEDEITIAKAIQTQLKSWNYNVEHVNDFKTVIQEFIQFDPQLVILDIGLPYFNGFYWCSEIRKLSKVPIIFLSSASDNFNVVMAMNMGGDDFIAKPFDITILIAKVNALMRRTYDFQSQTNVMEHKEVILNLNDTCLYYKECKLDLTKNEFKIMQLLMEYNGCVVSREKIMERLWDSDSFIDDNTLTVNMTRLRKKLEEIGLQDWITTKKGLGYIVE